MLCKPLEVFSSLLGRCVQVAWEMDSDHQKDNVQLNLLSSHIQLYILSGGEQQRTRTRFNVTDQMQSTNKKKKGYNICVFTPPPTVWDHNETKQQKASAL